LSSATASAAPPAAPSASQREIGDAARAPVT
jgi:hypothetical protein